MAIVDHKNAFIPFVRYAELIYRTEIHYEKKNNLYQDSHAYLSVSDIQKFLPLSRSCIYTLLHHSLCPTITIGKRLLVRQDQFEAFLQSLKNTEVYS